MPQRNLQVEEKIVALEKRAKLFKKHANDISRAPNATQALEKRLLEDLSTLTGEMVAAVRALRDEVESLR